MHFIAAFFIGLFGDLIGFFARHLGKRFSIGAAAAASFVGLTLLLFTAIKLVTLGLVYSVSDQWLLMGFHLLLPANAETCISAYLAAQVTAFLYRMNTGQLRLFL